MERTYVNSTMIVAIGYDPQLAVLEIEFKSNGVIWQYYDVPEYVWREFESATSIGKFFHNNIKGKYSEGRVG